MDSSAALVMDTFEAGDVNRSGYRIGTGPKVILMHELPGLSPVCQELGKRIAAEDFTVLMPLLFGKTGQDSTAKGFLQICIAREFTLLRLNRHSKITNWLRALARQENDGRGVAAIGMCVTGGLVLGMLLEEAVVAGVASQPSAPFAPPWSGQRRKRDVGLPPGDVAKVARAGKPLMAMRFKHDRLCPSERLETIADLGARTISVPGEGDYNDASPPIPARAHSVLTYDLIEQPDHPTNEAFREVIRFLKQHLQHQGS